MLVSTIHAIISTWNLVLFAAKPNDNMGMFTMISGTIQDPYAEFRVSEDATVTKERLIEQYNDTYWEKR